MGDRAMRSLMIISAAALLLVSPATASWLNPSSQGKASLIEQASWLPHNYGADQRMRDFEAIDALHAQGVAYMIDCSPSVVDCKDRLKVALLSLTLPKKWTADYHNFAAVYASSGIDLSFAGKVNYSDSVAQLADTTCETWTGVCHDMDDDLVPDYVVGTPDGPMAHIVTASAH